MFFKGISLKVNVIVLLEFELTHFESTVHIILHHEDFAKRMSPNVFSLQKLIYFSIFIHDLYQRFHLLRLILPEDHYSSFIRELFTSCILLSAKYILTIIESHHILPNTFYLL